MAAVAPLVGGDKARRPVRQGTGSCGESSTGRSSSAALEAGARAPPTEDGQLISL